jgi:head-tail adaptor
VQFRDQVERLRPTTSGDGYGNQVPTWAAPAIAAYPAEVQPLSTDENVMDQQRTTSRWRLFLPAGADVTAADRIRWDGDDYEIDGDVQRWKRRGAAHHLEAVLLKVKQG